MKLRTQGEQAVNVYMYNFWSLFLYMYTKLYITVIMIIYRHIIKDLFTVFYLT